MFKLSKQVPQKAYTENEQANPLRWCVLFKEEDGTFTPQTGWFKCKDYFNDMVAGLRGHHFSVYGMTNNIKYNTDAFYVLVKEVVTDDLLKHNWGNVVLPLVEESFGVKATMEVVESDKVLLTLPLEVLSSTYSISLLSWLLRVTAYRTQYTSLEEILAERDVYGFTLEYASAPSSSTHVPHILQYKLNVPERAKDYWYFSSVDYNSVRRPKESHSVHGCGYRGFLDCVRHYLKEEQCVTTN